MRRLPSNTIPISLLALLLMVPVAASDELPAAPPETVTVKLGPLGASIKAKGSLVPLRYERVACEAEVYRGKLEIVERAKEGPVVKGQILVRFDEEDYDKELASRERGLASARNKLERYEKTAVLAKEAAALKMEETVRKKRLADESLARFLEFERQAREKETVLGFQGQRDRIKDQQEEFEQLEKMYKADDLTEETEEIVLNRARRGLERSLRYFEFRKNRHDYSMKVRLPREEESLRYSARKAANALQMLEASAPHDAAQAEMDLANARREFKEKEESLAKFRADREKLTLSAPMAGYAVAGSFGGGKWSGLGSADTTLEIGNSVKAKQVLFTVVDDATLRVQTSVKEGDLLEVKAGNPATVTCALTGKAKFEAQVEDVARYGADGKYAVTLRVTTKDKRLRAGLSCSVTMPKSSGEDVLSIPASCVQKDKDGKQYVYVAGEDGEVTKTAVELGESADGRHEVKEGLKAGQKVLKSPPKPSEVKTEDGDDE